MKGRKIILTAVLTLCLLASTIPALAGEITAEQALTATASYVLTTTPAPDNSSQGGAWAILGLSRSNAAVPEGYYEGCYSKTVAAVQAAQGALSNSKYTEYSRTIIALSAMGYNSTAVGDYDLTSFLCDFDKVVKQGINGPIFALIAMDTYQYPFAVDAGIATREKYIEYILSKELPSGGWALSGNDPDADVTAMALQSLAPYQEQAEVNSAIERGLVVLANIQTASGGFASYNTENAESCVQVIVALTALGIDPAADSRFVKNGRSVVDALLSFYVEGGGFEHVQGGGINGMATEQGLYALAAYYRYQKGLTSLYNMTDLKDFSDGLTFEPTPSTPSTPATPVETPEPAVAPTGILFTDISGHWAEGLITGFKEGLGITNGSQQFLPNQAITRAEFCVALVNALGLSLDSANLKTFADVPNTAWYADEVQIAASHGLISGQGNGLFSPNDPIERQAIMAIIQRTAELENMPVPANYLEPEVILSQFSDAAAISAWAKEAVVFNVNNGIIVGSNGQICPLDKMTRAETMAVLKSLLAKLNLESQY